MHITVAAPLLLFATESCAAAHSELTRLSVGDMSFSARLPPGRSLAVRWRGESYSEYAAENTSVPLPSRLVGISDTGDSWHLGDDQYSALAKYAEVLQARASSQLEATAPQLEEVTSSRRLSESEGSLLHDSDVGFEMVLSPFNPFV